METKTETKPQIVIIRATQQAIADMILLHFNGVAPVVFDSLKEEDLRKIGCTFATLEVRRVLGDSDFIKTHRVTKEANPYLTAKTAIEEYKVQVLLNCVWQSVLDRRIEKHDGNEGFQAQGFRANGIENLGDSRVVCEKEIKGTGEKRLYLNYIVHKYLTSRVLHDENNQPIDADYLDGFLKSPKAAKDKSRQAEADKHGLELEFDPQNRQMKMSNIQSIRLLNVEYRPTEITTVHIVNESQQVSV